MDNYKITVQKVIQRDDENYTRDITLYEQIVSGDKTIVNAVARTVLDYNEENRAYPVSALSGEK